MLLLPPPSLRLSPRAGRLRCIHVGLRRHPEQPLHDAPLVFRHPGEGAAHVLVAHGLDCSMCMVPGAM